MAKLKPWYQVITPREDLRENRPLDASEFAVHLDHIRDNRAHPDYQKPERFFERTYLTKNLKTSPRRSCGGSRASRSRPPPSSTWRPSSAAARRTRSRPSTTWPAGATTPAPGGGSIPSSTRPRSSTSPRPTSPSSSGPSSTSSTAGASTGRAPQEDALGRDRLAARRREGVRRRRQARRAGHRPGRRRDPEDAPRRSRRSS